MSFMITRNVALKNYLNTRLKSQKHLIVSKIDELHLTIYFRIIRINNLTSNKK